jgi:chorismate dehydratase
MAPVRVSAVSYLNTRPLVRGLDRRPDLFTISFDVPSRCAQRLHDGDVDLGLIPAIEYLRGDYRLVPGVAIASDGPVASVAVFSRVPIAEVRALALDTSSRTSAALTRILCHHRWGIAPAFHTAAPELDRMLATADAALVIGDNALYADHAARGLFKIDLGAEWKALTGLPFVYAGWAGPEGTVTAAHVAALQAARSAGEADFAAIAGDYAPADAARAATALAYLRDNLHYGLGDAELAGLRRFHELAAGLGLVPGVRPLRFFQADTR